MGDKMNLQDVRLPAEMAEILAIIYGKAKKINGRINENLFVQKIFDDWLEQYRRREPGRPRHKDQVKLNNRLTELLQMAGKSQSQLSRETGINRTHLRYIITGKVEPSVTLAILILEALDFPPDKFSDVFYLEPVE